MAELAKEIVGGIANDLFDDRTSPEPLGFEAADNRDGDTFGFAHHEVRGGRDLVDNRDLGDHELAPECIGGSSQVGDGPDTGAADGNVGDTAAPGATKGVADDDGDVVAVPGPQAIADAAR